MKKYQEFFLSKNFQILEVKFSIYLNRRIVEMGCSASVAFRVYSLFSFLNNTYGTVCFL